MKFGINFSFNTFYISEQLELQELKFKKGVTLQQQVNFQRHKDMISTLFMHGYITESERNKAGKRFVRRLWKEVESIEK